MKSGQVTIVVPVYDDWSSLSQCIVSLKQHLDPTRHEVMLVNDCGPKVDLLEKKIKNSIRGLDNFTYYRNAKNLGFVGTCNRAVLGLDKTDHDILLLNSDTKVTTGFLDEMMAVLYSSADIGAVSPRSNNATIATIPLSAIKQKGIDPLDSYRLFRKLKTSLPRYSQVPTAHGFCMLIRRTLINRYGLFDEVFGKGYGEEVDFCQRLAKQGYKSVLANRAYVYHLEARSFSLETKRKLLEQNNQIIRTRYPSYQKSVQSYIEQALLREEGKNDLKHDPKNSRSTQPIKKLITKNPSIEKLARKIHSKLFG